MVAGTLFSAISCQRKDRQVPVNIGVQLQFEGSTFDVEGIRIILSDADGIVDYTATTNATGYAEFHVPSGQYSATTVYKILQNGERISYLSFASS